MRESRLMVSVADFRSAGDLARRVALDLWRIPETVDLVLAVSESGRLPAALLGLQISRPVVDLDWFLAEGRAHGNSSNQAEHGVHTVSHALLVDDIVRTGGTMTRARARLAEAAPWLGVTALAVYASDTGAAAVDLALEQADAELLLEWSLFRSPVMAQACLDMDGILCGDATVEQDDDGPHYLDFLKTTTRQVAPRGRIHRIVTSRLEKYRAETERWLADQGIEYGALTMLDLPSEAERRRLRPQARFKADVYAADLDAVLFVESESWQAREIARRVHGKAVFDYQTRTMLDSERINRMGLKHRIRNRLGMESRRVAQRFGLVRDDAPR